MDAGKALDGAAVDGDLVAHSLPDLGGGDGHVLCLAEHIGKLHADEVDAFLLHHADNIFFGIFAHTVKFPFHMKKRTSKPRFRSTRPLIKKYNISRLTCQEKSRSLLLFFA